MMKNFSYLMFGAAILTASPLFASEQFTEDSEKKAIIPSQHPSSPIQLSPYLKKEEMDAAKGDFQVLPDDMMKYTLSKLSIESLGNLSSTSTVMNYYCSQDPIWERIALNNGMPFAKSLRDVKTEVEGVRTRFLENTSYIVPVQTFLQLDPNFFQLNHWNAHEFVEFSLGKRNFLLDKKIQYGKSGDFSRFLNKDAYVTFIFDGSDGFIQSVASKYDTTKLLPGRWSSVIKICQDTPSVLNLNDDNYDRKVLQSRRMADRGNPDYFGIEFYLSIYRRK